MSTMSRRDPFCQCSKRVREGWSSLYSFEEIRVNTVLFKRDGCYTIKKIIRRFWEPSLNDVLKPGEARHLCRRFFWCHIGMDDRPSWFIFPHFPGFIQRREGIVAMDPTTRAPPDPSRWTGSSRAVARGSPDSSWEQEKIRLAKQLIQLELDMSRKLSELMVRRT